MQTFIAPLPPADLRFTKKDNQPFVWCLIRKKQLLCTPEEFVRQHLVHFLIHQLHLPIGRIACEVGMKILGQTRRSDIVVYSENGTPWIIIECKAGNVVLTDQTFLQISNYIQELGTTYFWLSNGNQHAIAQLLPDSIHYFSEFPTFSVQ